MNSSKTKKKITKTLVASFLAITVMSCSKNKQSQDPFPDHVPDPEVYAKIIARDTLVEIPTHAPLQAPVNMVLLVLNEGEERVQAEQVASDINGQIVGQLPAIGMYQIELDTNTISELDAAITTANSNPSVEVAGYDFEVQFRQSGCPEECDNRQIPRPNRCVFEDNEFLSTLTMFEEFRSRLNLTEIIVGVVDSGINVNNGQFDDVVVGNAHDLRGTPVRLNDPVGRGTQVAGIIAADDGDSATNGIASRFLKDKLKLSWGFLMEFEGDFGIFNPVIDWISCSFTVTSTELVIESKAKVVNLSLGFGEFVTPQTACWTSWQRLMARYPDVLFVAAAANEPFVLTNWNDAPAGIQLDNIITVGGSETCTPETLDASSASGPLIDITAQGVDMVLINAQNGVPHELGSGNSFATPQVASLAAILRSIDPNLTPFQTRRYIFDHAIPGPTNTAGRFMDIAGPVEQVMLDRTPAIPGDIADFIDRNQDGEHDPIGVVVTRICGGLNYRVQGYGSYFYNQEDIAGTGEAIVGGVFNPQGFGFVAQREASDYLDMGCTECSFALDEFTFTNATPVPPGMAALDFNMSPEDPINGPLGSASAGTWNIEACTIEQRDPVFDLPLVLSVEGQFSGMLEMMAPPDLTIFYREFSGAFNLPFFGGYVTDPLDPLILTIEAICENGRP